MTPHAMARLYTLAEIHEMRHTPPRNELDMRYLHGIMGAICWAQMPDLRCAFCNNRLEGNATYLIVMMPSDPLSGFGSSGACCVDCGVRLPREQLQHLAEQAAQVMFEPAAGHA